MQRLFHLALISRGWPLWTRYSLTVLLVVVTLGIRVALREDMSGYPFLLFFPTIILSGIVFNRGNGVLATILSAMLAVYFLIPPIGTLTVASAEDFVAVALFMAIGIITAMLVEALHVAFVQLAESHSQIERAAHQQAILLRELSHRMHNDLATIGSLLSMQARVMEDEAAKVALAGAADRVQVLTRVHSRLTMREDAAVVDSQEFITDLCDDLRIALLGLRPITLDLSIESHAMIIQRSIAVGLIINELLTNALKYAFPDPTRPGRIEVEFEKRNGEFCLSVTDNGVGPGDQRPGTGTGMGHNLVRMLAAQLGGSLNAQDAEPGSMFVVTFPARPV
jgi:two-component sensor histidine kinase